jgi:hypothetical protein
MSTTDDFNASSADDLGANWTQVYEGGGSGFMQRATDLQSIGWKQPEFSDGLTFYGSMPDSQGRTVGAKLRHDSTCTGCGKRFAKGDCILAELAPDMGGTFHHTDCDDPTLAKVVDE